GSDQPVLGHATGDMRVVMLYAHALDPSGGSAAASIRAGRVVGVQIVCQDLGTNAEEVFVEPDIANEGLIVVVVVQIAEMMDAERVWTPAECEGRLELPTDGKDGPRALKWQPNRLRRIASRAPNRRFESGDEPRHRIVATNVDRPVVNQKKVGDAG